MGRQRQTETSSGSGFAALLVLGAIIWVISFIIKHIWVILGGLTVIGSLYLARAILRDNRRRREEYQRYCDGVAAEADRQDDWVARGDERGIFGPAAADLMAYIRSGGRGPAPEVVDTSRPPAPRPLSPARQAAVPAVVAGGVGVALLLAQVGGSGSGSAPAPSTPTRTTSPYPTATQPPITYLPTPTPTYTPMPVAPSSSAAPLPEQSPTYAPTTTADVPPPTTYAPAPVYSPPAGNTYFRNCRQAHAAGRYNIPVGDPAYRPGLDRDGDGYACE